MILEIYVPISLKMLSEVFIQKFKLTYFVRSTPTKRETNKVYLSQWRHETEEHENLILFQNTHKNVCDKENLICFRCKTNWFEKNNS